MKEISLADDSGRETGLPRPCLAPGPLHILVKAKSRLQSLEKTRGSACLPKGLRLRGTWRAKPWMRCCGMQKEMETHTLSRDLAEPEVSKMRMNDPQVSLPALSATLLTHSALTTLASFLCFEIQQAHLPPQGLCTYCSCCRDQGSSILHEMSHLSGL